MEVGHACCCIAVCVSVRASFVVALYCIACVDVSLVLPV